MSDRVYVCHSLTRGGFAAYKDNVGGLFGVRSDAYHPDVALLTWSEAEDFCRVEKLRNRDWQIYGRPDLVRAAGPGFVEHIDSKAQPGLIPDAQRKP